MKVRSWISTCSTTNCTSTADQIITLPSHTTPNKLLLSDTSSSSDASGMTSTTSDTTYSGLQSNLSLQTLPSVPSLQKLSSDSVQLSVTLKLSLPSPLSLKPNPFQVINFLAVRHNRHLLYAASGNEIHVFDITTCKLIDTFYVNDSTSGSVKSITFSDKTVFTAHQDCRIRAWQLTASKKHNLIAKLPTVNDRLRRFLLPKNYVSVRRHKKRLWIEHNDTVSGLTAVHGKFMCSVSWDKYLKIWNTEDFRCVESVKAHDDAVNAVVTAPDGTIYTASADRMIKVWGRGEGSKQHALVATLEKHKSAVNALALSADGSVLFSGACDRSILVWEREDSANYMVISGALRGHGKAILCLINVSDLLFSGSADRTVRVWQRGINGLYCCLTVLDGHEKPVRSLAAVPDGGEGGGMKVFSGSFDGEIKVWQVVVSKSGGHWQR